MDTIDGEHPTLNIQHSISKVGGRGADRRCEVFSSFGRFAFFFAQLLTENGTRKTENAQGCSVRLGGNAIQNRWTRIWRAARQNWQPMGTSALPGGSRRDIGPGLFSSFGENQSIHHQQRPGSVHFVLPNFTTLCAVRPALWPSVFTSFCQNQSISHQPSTPPHSVHFVWANFTTLCAMRPAPCPRFVHFVWLGWRKRVYLAFWPIAADTCDFYNLPLIEPAVMPLFSTLES